MDAVGRNADPSLTLESLLQRSEVVTIGIDGGGLDDLLALSVIGRERIEASASADDAHGDDEAAAVKRLARRRWLHWTHAWAHTTVLDRRKEIAPRLQDFAADGDLTIVERVGDDIVQLADFIEQVFGAALVPEKGAIGVDPAGIGAIVDELAERQIDTAPEAGIVVGIPQGWKLMNAIKTVERKLAAGQFIHGGTRMMSWCVGNAKVEPKGNAIVITKQASGFAKIDPLMATFDAAALMSLNPRLEGRGIFEFYKSAAQATKPGAAAKPAKVRLRAPTGISNVYGTFGNQYLVGADRIVDVDEGDAKPLLARGFEMIGPETVN
jgi:phage terminase large subunit-like protein